jgi:class 3 adenylate cyclase
MDAERAYPLRSRFVRLILPGLLLYAAATVAVVTLGTRAAIHEVYVDLAQREVASLEHAIANAAPREWRVLLSAPSASTFLASEDGQRLQRAVRAETAEWQADAMTIYAPDGRVLFARDATRIDTHGPGAEVPEVAQSHDPRLVQTPDHDGRTTYQLFLPVVAPWGRPEVVIEIDRAADAVSGIVSRNLLAPAAISASLMLLLVGGLVLVVNRAQRELDRHARLLTDLRQKLERYISRGAIEAARDEALDVGRGARRLRCTLLYADVRDFSGFAETAAPEAVASFLTDVATVISRRAREQLGDVDKFVGDGALIRFEGPDRERRAVEAGRAMLVELEERRLPRRLGIGVFDGEALLTVIGADERRDFTTVGDSVNIAARLCAAAAPGEIVAAETVVEALAERGREFGRPSEIPVKGRAGPLRVRRWASPCARTVSSSAAEPTQAVTAQLSFMKLRAPAPAWRAKHAHAGGRDATGTAPTRGRRS